MLKMTQGSFLKKYWQDEREKRKEKFSLGSIILKTEQQINRKFTELQNLKCDGLRWSPKRTIDEFAKKMSKQFQEFHQ